MIYLAKIEPERNMARFYALDVQPTLFGDWALLKEYGAASGATGSGARRPSGRSRLRKAALLGEFQRRIQRGYQHKQEGL